MKTDLPAARLRQAGKRRKIVPRAFRMTLAYDGTCYRGWQRQSSDRDDEKTHTIQGVVERALGKITGEPLSVAASGRTDAGVHALGQVALFKLRRARAFSAGELRCAMNAVLPEDIRVMRLSRAPRKFHPRFQAKRKMYAYHVYDGPVMPPTERLHAVHSPRRLDCAMIRRCMRALRGRHDFSAFHAAGGEAKSGVRTLYRASVNRKGSRVVMRFEADGFLRHMVRILAGTLMLAGRGLMTPDGVKAALESRDRSKAGPTAPAHGLVLEKVVY